jgi:uncharacterized phage protein gp47/JayE
MTQPGRLTHTDEAGHARMVDVSAKDVTVREARASGRVLLSADAIGALRAGEVPKGDALAVARIAGIQAAKILRGAKPGEIGFDRAEFLSRLFSRSSISLRFVS